MTIYVLWSYNWFCRASGGMPHNEDSTGRQVGPILDRGPLDAGIYDLMVHQVWMCYLIYAHLPLNAQQLDKTLLLMFLNKLADLALRQVCSAAAGGRFSKSVLGLYRYVGMNPSVQLVTELNTMWVHMHMSYINLDTLALALPKQQLTLQKSTAEQRCVWEMLRVLDRAQHKEHDQDVACALQEMSDNVLAAFSRWPDDGQAIYEDTVRKVMNQVAVCATQHAIRNRVDQVLVGMGAEHTTQTHILTTNNCKLRGLVTTTVANTCKTCASVRLSMGTAWISSAGTNMMPSRSSSTRQLWV